MTPETPTHRPLFSPAAYVAAVAVGLVSAGIEIVLLFGAGQVVLPQGGLFLLIGVFLAFPAALILFLPGAAASFFLAGKLRRLSLAYYAVSGALVATGTVLAVTAVMFEATAPAMVFALYAAIPGVAAGLTYRAVERRTPPLYATNRVGGAA